MFAIIIYPAPTSESPTIEDFGYEIGMTAQETENLKLILVSVEQGDLGILHSLGIKVGDYCSLQQMNHDILANQQVPCQDVLLSTQTFQLLICLLGCLRQHHAHNKSLDTTDSWQKLFWLIKYSKSL